MMSLGCLPLLPGNKDDYLRKSAQKGNEKAVKKLLRAGVPADPRKPHHTSALQLAAISNHLECAKALVEAGADVNRVADGSPLLDAAAHGHVAMVQLLLDHKADPAKSSDGDTVIHVAARSGHQAVIDILATRLEMGSIIAAGNADGKTPLMLACSQTQNSDACIGYLLSLGADPAAEDLAGNTALHHAATVGNLSAAKLLLAAGSRGIQALSIVNNKGRTPLHLAAVFGREDVVVLLAKQDKSDVNVKDKEGSTVLHMVCKSMMCAMSGQLSMAKAVLDHGADPEAVDEAGNTPGHYTSYASVKTLLESHIGAKSEPKLASQQETTQALALTAEAARSSELPISNSYAATQAASTKADKLAGALASALGIEAGAQADEANWVAKHAMRRHTSEEADGWKLTTAADEGAHLDSPQLSVTGPH